MLHLTLLTFVELVKDGEIPLLIMSKARSVNAAYKPVFCSLSSSCICLNTKIMSAVRLSDLNPHWLSDVFFCVIVGMSLFTRKRAKNVPAVESRVMLR